MNKRDKSVRRRRSWILLVVLGLVLALSPAFAERMTVQRLFDYLNTYLDEEPYCVPADVHANADEVLIKAGKLTARCWLHLYYPVCEER